MAILSPGAAAEEKAARQQLDPIVVTPSRVPENPYGQIFGTTILQSSKSADVIDSEEIAQSGARTVPELLKGHVGINVKEYMGNGKTAQVDLRGFGETAPSNTLVLIDGRRTNQVDISGTDWMQIDINSIERVEIVRGPQSVLYGDNASGGVINIITKRGKGVKPEIGLAYETGSYHYNKYAAGALGGSPFLDYAINASTSDSNGFRGNSDLDQMDYTNTFTIRPADYCRVRLDGGYHKDWFGMPGSVTDQQIVSDGWRVCDDPGNRGKTEDLFGLVGLDIFGMGGASGTTISTDVIARSRRSATLSFFTPDWYESNSHIRTFGITPKASIESSIGCVSNRLVAGVDYYLYKDSITSTNWANMLFGDKRQKDIITIQEQTVGIYASDTAALTERLNINGGVRGEWAGWSIDQEFITPSMNDKRAFEYAFDCGANYMYNETSAVYANIARTFRFPAVDEWYQSTISVFGTLSGGLNLDLVPQSGMNYEVGIRDHSLKWLKVNADCFLMDTRHELYYDPITFANAVHDHTMRNGVELETHIMPLDALDIYADYTFEKAYYVGPRFAGNEIPMVPTQMLTWGITYTYMDCFDVDYKFNFVGPQRFVSDQLNLNRTLKQYITNDIRLAYHKYGFEVFGKINNIFDFNYSEIGSWSQYYPANGRNFVIGVKQKF